MNKKIAAIFLAAAIAAAQTGMTALADEPITISVNGEELIIPEDDTQPFIENERTLVPMRVIFEALGASVNWDSETRTIVSYYTSGDITIQMEIDSDKMLVNDTSVELDVPAKIVNDRTVVPVRAIAEGMNCNVGWDGETRTVIITSEEYIEPNTNPGDPWMDCGTLDEINSAISEFGEGMYRISDPTVSGVEVIPGGYRYFPENNLSELICIYSEDEVSSVTIKTAPAGTENISEYQGGVAVDEYTLDDGSVVKIYNYEDTLYAEWTDGGLERSVAAVLNDNSTELVKQLIEDVHVNFPKVSLN